MSAEPARSTLFAKGWAAHRVATLDADTDLIAIDRILLHERTGGIALRGLAERGRGVRDPSQAFAVMDHVVDTCPGRTDETPMPGGAAFIETTRRAAHDAGIRVFDIGDPAQRIVHVVSPERGIVLPGLTLVCPDSYTGTQGALGALAWGIGSTEAEHALATGTLRVKRPMTMRITLAGAVASGVTAKDLALAIIARIGAGGGSGHIVEFAGPAITALPIEAGMTLCNMATELSAFAAIIAPDAATIDYLKDSPHAPQGELWDRAVADWRGLASDAHAVFDRELELDAGGVVPMVTWGTSPQQAVRIDDAVPDRAASTHDSGDSHRPALDYTRRRILMARIRMLDVLLLRRREFREAGARDQFHQSELRELSGAADAFSPRITRDRGRLREHRSDHRSADLLAMSGAPSVCWRRWPLLFCGTTLTPMLSSPRGR